MSKTNYIPSHKRPGFDESKVIKLPNGWSSQTQDCWGNKNRRRNGISETSRMWNMINRNGDDL